jgi:hypothetical protein
VAEINSQGGYVKQYKVLVNPDRLRHYDLTLKDVYEALGRNNANSGGGILPQNAEQYLIRGVGLVQSLDDIRLIVVKEVGGTPVYPRRGRGRIRPRGARRRAGQERHHRGGRRHRHDDGRRQRQGWCPTSRRRSRRSTTRTCCRTA